MSIKKQFIKSGSASRQRGQGMSEYIIIVAIIAIASIGVFGMFGSTIRTQVAAMAKEMSGEDAAATITEAKAKATLAAGKAAVNKNMENYGDSN
jgi:Flp pilus assembly pilin Flp